MRHSQQFLSSIDTSIVGRDVQIYRPYGRQTRTCHDISTDVAIFIYGQDGPIVQHLPHDQWRFKRLCFTCIGERRQLCVCEWKSRHVSQQENHEQHSTLLDHAHTEAWVHYEPRACL